MLIRYGYSLTLATDYDTPVVTLLDIHPDRRGDVLAERPVRTSPIVPGTTFHDSFGNICRRFKVPAGTFTLSAGGVIVDTGQADAVAPDAEEIPVDRLPDSTLVFLLGSRYCETDQLSQMAWDLFGSVQPGWTRVQAIADYVHDRITFGYGHARSTRTALEAHRERVGVCRDFAHLAIALCRCMNIPARYVNGYLGDIAVPAVPDPMDFSAWFEVFLGGRWYTFDARHNRPRVGRIVIARGRDATDVPLIHSFGPHQLVDFSVVTEEVDSHGRPLEQQQVAVARAAAAF